LTLLSDKEAINTALEKYKEHMENLISKCEKDITNRIKKEWTDIEKGILDNQHSRNRAIVKEIIETCIDFRNTLREEFEKMAEDLEME
jgi:DNA-directed RNA polymerase subunit L